MMAQLHSEMGIGRFFQSLTQIKVEPILHMVYNIKVTPFPVHSYFCSEHI